MKQKRFCFLRTNPVNVLVSPLTVMVCVIMLKSKIRTVMAIASISLSLAVANPQARAQSIYTPYAFTNFAGLPGGPGFADGTGGAARFSYPSGVTVDTSGNVYVADSANGAIRKIPPDGTVTTLASGFNWPNSVAVDSAGNLYVADTFDSTIRKITPDGTITILAGNSRQSGSADGAGSAARFSWPRGVAVDSAGNVYVADTDNFTIRKITPDGAVTTLAGSSGNSGANDGVGSAARFGHPFGVAADSAGNVYVADWNMTIRKITSDGTVTTLAGSAGQNGSADGTGSAARFNYPMDVAVDAAGNLYVADEGNSKIRKITPDGVVTTLAGAHRPAGVAVDTAGNVYVANKGNSTIGKITPDMEVTTFAGRADQAGSADGTGSAARFSMPFGVAVDGAGNLYVADTGNRTVRKITAAAEVTTLAGSPGQYGTNDGVGNEARFHWPHGVAADGSGNVYVVDTASATIRKITSDGAVTTLAGSPGKGGTNDGIGSAARFSLYYVDFSPLLGPYGVAADDAGVVYVADTGNYTIRKITPDGFVTTLAGGPRQAGTNDGTGSAARFSYPYAVAVDSEGNVYVGDTGSATIRKITPVGTVTTIAGSPGRIGDVDGLGSAARFRYPAGVAVDSTGNVYVADTTNDRITKGVLPNSAPLADASATATRVISRNNLNARIVLDGSRSQDVDNDPLQFSWFVGDAATASATGRVAVVTLAVGAHDVLLRLDDGKAVATNRVSVRVLTAAGAVEELIAHVKAAKFRHPQSLLSQLNVARRAFAGDKFELGAHHLQLTQDKLRELLARNSIDPNTAAALLQEAQTIIAVVMSDAQSPQLRFSACKCEKDGRIGMHFSGVSGRTYLIETSPDLKTWVPVGIGGERGHGEFEFEEPGGILPTYRFYRIVAP